jgi:hypothetical protein
MTEYFKIKSDYIVRYISINEKDFLRKGKIDFMKETHNYMISQFKKHKNYIIYNVFQYLVFEKVDDHYEEIFTRVKVYFKEDYSKSDGIFIEGCELREGIKTILTKDEMIIPIAEDQIESCYESFIADKKKYTLDMLMDFERKAKNSRKELYSSGKQI